MSMELISREKAIDMINEHEYSNYVDCMEVSDVLAYVPTVKAIPIKQLEEMYDKFQQKLWREHEDVRGDDMIEVGYAEQFLQELLMEFGCWDKEVEHGTLFDETNGR